jgi:hypothetical protein
VKSYFTSTSFKKKQNMEENNKDCSLGQAKITVFFDESKSLLSISVHEAK